MLKFKTTDTTGSVEYTVTDSGRNPINLIGCSVYFLMEDAKTKELILNEEATVIDPSKGMIKYQFSDVAMLKNGMFNAEFHIVFPDNKRKIVPSNGYIQISVMRNLDDSRIGSIQEGIIIEVSKIEAFKNEITETIEGFKQEYNGIREATDKATTAAAFAKTQGDRAKSEADRLQGTDVSKLDQQVRTINEQLTASNRHHQILSHGQHILNGSQNAPLDIQIEGRTLIPMQNTVLDAGKYYVLADKKTSLKWADNTVTQGIAKFTGKAEKPRVIKVTNFEGKVAGSTVENPHFAVSYSSSNLVSTTIAENFTQNRYNDIFSLNGSSTPTSTQNNGQLPQQLFSFNLIEEVERTIGRIPRATVADKVQWLKDNVARLACNWYGFGSAVTGNKASLAMWNSFSNFWNAAVSTSSSTVAKLAVYSTTISERVDAKGFVHFLAYGEPSDGATPSIINTDYVDFEIEFKTTATLHDPCIPLYEVDRTEYDKILANYDENAVLAQYPRVQGVQHLQNPYVIAEGENLLPPFYEWTLHSNAVVLGPYELEINATANQQNSFVDISVISNQLYTIKSSKTLHLLVYAMNNDGSQSQQLVYSSDTLKTFTIPIGITKIRLIATNLNNLGLLMLSQPMLTLGATTKPFVARNPSHLFANAKLGQIGDRKDTLFRDNGEWKLRKAIVKDMQISGMLEWLFYSEGVGFKNVYANGLLSNRQIGLDATVATKYNGKALMKLTSTAEFSGGDCIHTSSNNLFLSISNDDTGFSYSYTPSKEEIKAYFNGWKVKLIDLNGKPTAWQSVVDGKDALTQTLAYVSVNRAPNYTPYKLSYVLASPVTEVVTVNVEGDIAINGLTQVEVGSGVIIREKAKTEASSTVVHINDVERTNTYLRYKSNKIINIYKNGAIDNGWAIASGRSFGITRASLPISDFDATAEYTVTYLALDRQLFTTNPVSIPVSLAGSLKGTVTDVVNKQADDRAQISVNTRLIYDMLLRLKAGGL